MKKNKKDKKNLNEFKKRFIIITILLGLSLIFSGCSIGNSNGNSNKQNGLFGLGGSSGSGSSSSGVNLEFAKNNPPSKMIKGAPYNFVFIFKNFQKEDITDMRLKIKGFDRSYVNGLNKEYSVAKIPKSTIASGPGIFSGLQIKGVIVDGFTNNFLLNPSFEYCYSTKTLFREQLCVPSKENVCDIKVDTSTQNNGPVKVKIDRINSIGNKIRLDFSINNQGNGKVVNSCFNIKEYSNSYKLNFVKLGTIQGDCKAVSGYNLNKGKSNFYCLFTRNQDTAYASQLSVDIGYKYDSEVKKQISVKDLNSN